MGQLRLANLAILSIEHEMADEMDFDVVIGHFAEGKARKIVLQWMTHWSLHKSASCFLVHTLIRSGDARGNITRRRVRLFKFLGRARAALEDATPLMRRLVSEPAEGSRRG